MYNFAYVSKHNTKVKRAYNEINKMINDLHKMVKKYFTFRIEVIGSYKRNMITYDAKSNIGFDFDFNIIVNPNAYNYTPKKIKESILLEDFKNLARKYHFDKVENSTRVITLKKVNKKKSKILYGCDFAIVKNHTDADGNDYQEYIRFNKKSNQYQWCEQSNGFFYLDEKYKWLIDDKEDVTSRNQFRNELRELYLKKKNANTNKNLHSRHIFALTVHEMCQSYGYYD